MVVMHENQLCTDEAQTKVEHRETPIIGSFCHLLDVAFAHVRTTDALVVFGRACSDLSEAILSKKTGRIKEELIWVSKTAHSMEYGEGVLFPVNRFLAVDFSRRGDSKLRPKRVDGQHTDGLV